MILPKNIKTIFMIKLQTTRLSMLSMLVIIISYSLQESSKGNYDFSYLGDNFPK